MSNPEIYDKWTQFINNPLYKKYFLSNEEYWIEQLNECKKYINDYKVIPIQRDIINKQLGLWIRSQIKNYKIKRHIMSNEIIYNKWTGFINDPLYKKYF